MGRPRKITGEVRAQLLAAFRSGLPASLACEYAGVGYRTYFDELRRDPQFAQEAARARAHGAKLALDLIQAAAQSGDWRAAARYLELAHPTHFGPRARIELSGWPVEVRHSVELSQDELREALRALVETQPLASRPDARPAEALEPVRTVEAVQDDPEMAPTAPTASPAAPEPERPAPLPPPRPGCWRCGCGVETSNAMAYCVGCGRPREALEPLPAEPPAPWLRLGVGRGGR